MNKRQIKNKENNQVGNLLGIGNFSAVKNYYPELQKTIEELKESEAKYRSFLEISPDAIVVVDLKGKIKYANQEFAGIHGLNSPEELFGKSSFDLIVEEDRPYAMESVKTIIEQGLTKDIELRFLGKDGALFPTEVSGNVIRNDRDKPEYLLLIAKDITVRKHVEDKLDESRRMLDDVLNCIPVRVFWKDLNGIYLGCNRLFANDAGRKDPDEIIGCDDYSMSWHNEAERYRRDDEVVVKSGVPRLNYEEPQTTPDGETIWLNTSKIPLRDKEGNIYGVLGTYEDISERKRIDIALRESERKLSTLMSNIPGMIYRCRNDSDWSMEFVSDGCTALTGYKPEDLTNNNRLSFADIIHKDDKETVWENIQNALENKTSYRLNYRITTAENELRWVWEQGQGVFNDDGELLVLEGLITNITERKEYEQALSASQVKFETLFNDSPVPLWEEDFTDVFKFLDQLRNKGVTNFRSHFDSNPEDLYKSSKLIKVMNVNTAALALHEADSKEELLGNLEKIFSEKSYQVFKEEMVSLSEGKSEIISEGEVKTLKGNSKYVYLKFKINTKTGNNYRALVATTDITERKLVEKALHESENKYRSLIQNSNDAIYLLFNNKFEMINNKFSEMFGYSHLEAREENFDLMTIVSDKSKYLIEERNRRSLKGETLDSKYEFIAVTKNGTEIDCEVNTTYLSYKNGTAIQGIIRDVTDRKKMTSALIEAKESAERSERLKSEFLAQMSHEIRTPLNVMMSYTSLLKEELADNQTSEHLHIFKSISNAGSRIIRTIDLILNSSELQAGAYKLIIKKVDLFQDIIVNVYNDLKSLLDSKDVELSIKRSVNNSFVKCDEYSVYQSVMNLVDNAIKYTNKGFIEIRLLQNNSNQLKIEIEDSGIGISDEYIGKLFDAFSQEESGYSRRFEGTGLGLSLVKNYCDLNNIKIDLESKKNEGTKFTLTFPQV